MIELNKIIEFEDLLSNGLTIKQATIQLNQTIKKMRVAYANHERAWPTAGQLDVQVLCEQISKGLKAGLTQKTIASKLKLSQPYICQLVRKYRLNEKANTSYRKRMDRACNRVIDYVITHGGSVQSAIKALKVNVHSQTVWKRAKEQSVDLTAYRYASQRFGSWEILPGRPASIYKADFLVNALCHGCGTKHCVSLVNLKSGASTQCSSCAKRGVKFRQVRRESTGEIYRSIRSFVKAVGIDKQYQSIRKSIVKVGSIVIAGEQYCLLD